MIVEDPNWAELALKPGQHLAVLGADLFTAFYARAIGLELRDTIMHVHPGGVEVILLFRKPLDGTVANNILTHGQGGLNIDGCRVRSLEGNPSTKRRETARRTGTTPHPGRTAAEDKVVGRIGRRGRPEVYMAERPSEKLGRWPPNMILSHAPTCQQTGTQKVKAGGPITSGKNALGIINDDNWKPKPTVWGGLVVKDAFVAGSDPGFG